MNILQMRKILKDPEVKDLHGKAKEIERLKKQIAKTKDPAAKVALLEKCLELTEYISKESLQRAHALHAEMALKAMKLAEEKLECRKVIAKLEKKAGGNAS